MRQVIKYFFITAIFITSAGGGVYLLKNYPAKQGPVTAVETKTPFQQPEITEEEKPEVKEVSKLPQKIVKADLSSAPGLFEIKNCLGNPKVGDCLDNLFKIFFDNGGDTNKALSALNKYEANDEIFRLGCHPVVHAVGRMTFAKYPTVHDAFAECNQTCHSGCYHGAMERFLRGDRASDDQAEHISEEELINKAVSACDPSLPLRFRFQCLHGLGHALVFYLDYDLERSLMVCEKQPDQWSKSSCFGGAFMENVHSATPEKRDLSATDFHYPCSKLADNFRADCYMMQTTRMTEMGLNTDRIFEECKKAGNQRFQCFQSAGRDLSNDARIGDPKIVSSKCEKVFGEDRKACMLGVEYALIDNTWDGKYALPFCESFLQKEDVDRCFDYAAQFMKSTYTKTSAEIKLDCEKFLKTPLSCIQSAEK